MASSLHQTKPTESDLESKVPASIRLNGDDLVLSSGTPRTKSLALKRPEIGSDIIVLFRQLTLSLIFIAAPNEPHIQIPL